MDPVEAVLAHHGIKGMKWGVRRSASALARSRAKGPAHEDAAVAKATAHQIKKGGTSSVSNKDLQALVTRMNLEQQYGKLKANKPSRFKSGHAHVKTVLSVGKTVNDVHSVATGPVGKAIKAAVKAKK